MKWYNIKYKIEEIFRVFFPTNFGEKYTHVGYSYPSVPDPWKPIVKDLIINIEKEIYPRWIPMFIKRLIYYIATENSIVRISNRLIYYNVYKKISSGGQTITQIKDKYATLRVYGHFNDKIYNMIEIAENKCDNICENCGSNDDVQFTDTHWVYNLCKNCRKQ